MEKEYKYRIKVEVIGEPDADWLKAPERAREGFECDGFVILGSNAEGSFSYIDSMSVHDIAKSILPSDLLLQGAILAQAYFNTDMVEKEHAMHKLLAEAITSKEE